MSKVLSVADAARQVRAAQQSGERVVMCHGCFDIVHPGHIRHLEHAARHGQKLLVTITGDSVMNKGTGRPLIPQELRAENLAALRCVDWVAINNLPTAAELLDEIRPDAYVKGREYEHNRDPRFALERQIVERHGGRVVFSSGDVIFSSTALIAAIEDSLDPFQARVRQLVEQHSISARDIEPIIERFRGQRVLVVGQTIIDTYVMCDRPDVAGESPIMTLRPIEHRSFDGGAAIIARHLSAMGARPILLTGLPKSARSESLRQRLAIEGIELRSIETDGPIIEKQRFLVGSSKVMKLDLGEPATLDATRQQELVTLAAATAHDCAAAIVADYGVGLLTSATLSELCAALRPRVGFLAGDVSGRRSNLLAMQQMDLLCPSESEVRDALQDFDEGLSSVVWRLMERTRSKAAMVTLGPEGLIAFQQLPGAELEPEAWKTRLSAEHVPSFAPFAVDQLGCGDALLAAATLTLISGGSLAQAAILGSLAAGAQAQRLGNAVIGAADLRRGLQRLCGAQLTYSAEPSAALAV